jgi:hypothetical protein
LYCVKEKRTIAASSLIWRCNDEKRPGIAI